MLLFYLAIGGAAGTLARYGLGGWVQGWAGAGFPWGTFAVNLAGSFLLGLFIRLADAPALAPELRAMLTVGFCGAFTTFSTLSYETVVLLQKGEWGRAAAYSLGSLALGLVALAAGMGSVMRADG